MVLDGHLCSHSAALKSGVVARGDERGVEGHKVVLGLV